VQFAPPKNYQQIYAGQVWDLFRSDYSDVQEHPPISPNFETFGIPHQRLFSPQIQFATGANHDRFWFLRPGGDELIQFQQDRLLHNWRKVGGLDNPYPRFESMIARFSDEVTKLENFVSGLVPQKLQINQCEISYINQIDFESPQGSKVSNWIKFLNFDGPNPGDLSISFREVIRDSLGNPVSRLTCEIASATAPTGDGALLLTLTVRGAPRSTGIQSALEFIASGREVIVQRFAELTSDEAHKKWGRTK
jgi:uncharacterized protein (TIGR04255 family)